MVYAWFSASRLNRMLEEFHVQGFHPVVRQETYIVLKKDSVKPDGYDMWKDRIFNEVIIKQALVEEGVW